MKYYLAIKKEMMPFAAILDLEIIILSEVSQRNKYHMILLICGILKKKGGKWAYLQNINRVTDIENNLIVTRGEGEG